MVQVKVLFRGYLSSSVIVLVWIFLAISPASEFCLYEGNGLTLSQLQMLSDASLQQTTFENNMTKEEIAYDEQIILLLQCFQRNFSFCHNVFNAISLFATMFSTFSHRLFIQLQRFSIFLTKYVHSNLLQNCRMRERVKVYSVLKYLIG